MNVGDERTQSLWMDVEVAADAQPLASNDNFDVVVIGSGITGLSTAYELVQRGQQVVVLDRGKIGRGMTARTTAHLVSGSDDGLRELIDRRGLDAARQFYRSHAAAIDRIEHIQRQEKIGCDFSRLDGFLFPAQESDASWLDEEHKAAQEIGMPLEFTRGVPLNGCESTRALRYPDQATFHPTKYLRGLAQAIGGRGGWLYANLPATAVEEKNGSVTVTTEGGRELRAKYAVVATNSPIVPVAAIHSKQAPYRTYAMAFSIARGALPNALYWDTQDPYHYVRLQAGDSFDYVIVGGEDHKSGAANDGERRYAMLERWARQLIPQLGDVTHRWSGQVLEPIDYVAFTGHAPGKKNVFVHTGDSGQGITHGVIASMLIAQLIADGSSEWQELYDPERKTPTSVTTFIDENLSAVKHFADYVAPGDVSSYDDIKPGQGAIVREGLKKVAAYRDEQGRLTTHAAACTHLGCQVHWNSLERCWDCGCHGSQFAADGAVLNGPAVKPLEPVSVDESRRKSA
jgi:glycine/D-amino acid oxidase-like deaminating enzyme/nitrite reductase/ring-hydroxylating ferredoxin subunit